MFLYLIFVGIISIVLIPAAKIIGLFNEEKRLLMSFHFVRWCMRVFKNMSGADVTYKGLAHIAKKDAPVAYIGNHRGIFDIILTYSVMNEPTAFVAKKEMKNWPLFGWWMNLANCIFMDRSSVTAGLKTILLGIEKIKSGTSMMIFPEGTRSKTEGKLLDFKSGSFKLATKPKINIVPVAINNTSMIFEDHIPSVKKAKVVIEFCEPIDTSALSKEEEKSIHKYVQSIIEEKVITNGKSIGSIPDNK